MKPPRISCLLNLKNLLNINKAATHLWIESLQALTAKPATAFPEIFYIAIIASYVSANNCSLNPLNL